jgi:hypothetical protein
MNAIVKMKEYRQDIKFSCGHKNMVLTLGYKPKIDNKQECPHCRSLRLQGLIDPPKRINEYGIDIYTLPEGKSSPITKLIQGGST